MSDIRLAAGVHAVGFCYHCGAHSVVYDSDKISAKSEHDSSLDSDSSLDLSFITDFESDAKLDQLESAILQVVRSKIDQKHKILKQAK